MTATAFATAGRRCGLRSLAVLNAPPWGWTTVPVEP